MTYLTPLIWLAGGLQLLIASANFFAPRMLHYGDNLRRVDRTFRDVCVVHCIYIVLILVAFAALCFTFTNDLAGGSLLGRCVSGFLAFFWGLRVAVQLFHYNSEIKRQHPVFNLLFVGSFIILTAVFALAAIG